MTDSTRRRVIIALRVALIAGLLLAGWRIYRHAPRAASDSDAARVLNANGERAASLRVVLRRGAAGDEASQVEIEAYPAEITRAEANDARAAQLFGDAPKLPKKRPALTRRLDANGQTTLELSPGEWRIQASLVNSARTTAWRIPVTLTSGERQTIELTQENAYVREKSF